MKAEPRPDLTVGHDGAAMGAAGLVGAAGDWTREVTRFATHRLNAYVGLAMDLSRCGSPPAAMGCYARFMTNTVEDYIGEAATLQALAGRMASEAILVAEAAPSRVKAPVLE